jgi:hypothetical protein
MSAMLNRHCQFVSCGPLAMTVVVPAPLAHVSVRKDATGTGRSLFMQ